METELVGLKKFTNEYNSSFKPTSVLKEEVWRVIEQHKSENEERKLESKRKRPATDEDGWTMVTKSGFRR